MPKVETCLSPALFPHFDVEGKTVVIIDVFRATSTIVSALDAGILAIKPVEHLEEAAALGEAGWLAASERGGMKSEGFDYGNSPLEYRDQPALVGEKLALTTTNGTKITIMSAAAAEIIAGALINISAVAEHLQKSGRDVLLFCAGWQDRVNFEDTLCAGALADKLGFEIGDDNTLCALGLWQSAKSDLNSWASRCSHARRLSHRGMLEDVKFCLEFDSCKIVPVLREGLFVL